jgi:hypothetical protein
MLQIKHEINDDGTIRFNANDKGEGISVDSGASELAAMNTLLLKINGSKGEIIEIIAEDGDIYDGLMKTAVAYAFRRGITFDKPLDLKPTKCKQIPVEVKDVVYDVLIQE